MTSRVCASRAHASLLPLLALASACAHAPAPRATEAPAPIAARDAAGAHRSEGELVDALATAPVVCFGERHDDARDHVVELRLVTQLAERPGRFAIGLEMVERTMQPVLDDWVAGRLDEASLLERLDWAHRWGFDFALYRPLFEHARDRAIPLLALNARREVVRRVVQLGAEGARGELGDEVPPLTIDATYRSFVTDALEGHDGLRPEQLEGFVAAQRTWDEVMGSVVASALAREPGPSRVFVVAGAFHCAYGLGIPSVLAARGIGPVAVVLGADVDLPTVPGRNLADFVVE